MESVTNLDSTGAHELYEWITDWRKSGLDVCLSGTRGPVRDKLRAWGLIDCVGADHMFLDDEHATAFFENRSSEPDSENLLTYAVQSRGE